MDVIAHHASEYNHGMSAGSGQQLVKSTQLMQAQIARSAWQVRLRHAPRLLQRPERVACMHKGICSLHLHNSAALICR